MKKFNRQFAWNLTIILLVFLLSMWIHPGPLKEEIRVFGGPAFCFYSFHLMVSLLLGKYERGTRYTTAELINRYNLSWILSFLFALAAVVLLQLQHLSRQVIFTNLFGLLAGEYLIILFVTLFRESVPLRDPEEITLAKESGSTGRFLTLREGETGKGALIGSSALENAGPEILEFISNHCPPTSDSCLVADTPDSSPLLSYPEEEFRSLINIRQINRVRHINHFLQVAHSRLRKEGMLVICAETSHQRKARIMRKYPPLLNKLYYSGDYLLMRVIPSLPPFRKIWSYFTHGQSKVVSRPEILGRLSACGFTIAEEKGSNGLFMVAARKTGLPVKNGYPSYGVLIHLNRVGQNGKMIKMYKLRTMHPYSEYIQDYVYQQNNLAPGGKLRNDFRITRVGRQLRRYWIDELPGLWNWIRGDVKLVGVRPLSKHYFSLYTPELQQRRIRVKPGLIPPFYADLPQTLEEIQASEMRYLDAYEKAPLRTDFRYFRRAVYNIVWKGAKSR
ncbi:MAG TPA: sugar transferase [Prolixibacteraceae bacterium]|nr:sugar transferase [Prolixibacteraceae bacterium]